MQFNPQAAGNVLNAATSLRPSLGIVLGSAFGQVAESIEVDAIIDFADLPGCAASSVEGHIGQFMIGRLGGVVVLAQAGRLHYYEGYYTAKCEALPNYDAMSKDERKEWVDAKVGYECERHGI